MLMLGMMKVRARAQIRGTAVKCINATFMHSHRFFNNKHSKRSLVINVLGLKWLALNVIGQYCDCIVRHERDTDVTNTVHINAEKMWTTQIDKNALSHRVRR